MWKILFFLNWQVTYAGNFYSVCRLVCAAGGSKILYCFDNFVDYSEGMLFVLLYISRTSFSISPLTANWCYRAQVLVRSIARSSAVQLTLAMSYYRGPQWRTIECVPLTGTLILNIPPLGNLILTLWNKISANACKLIGFAATFLPCSWNSGLKPKVCGLLQGKIVSRLGNLQNCHKSRSSLGPPFEFACIGVQLE